MGDAGGDRKRGRTGGKTDKEGTDGSEKVITWEREKRKGR